MARRVLLRHHQGTLRYVRGRYPDPLPFGGQRHRYGPRTRSHVEHSRISLGHAVEPFQTDIHQKFRLRPRNQHSRPNRETPSVELLIPQQILDRIMRSSLLEPACPSRDLTGDQSQFGVRQQVRSRTPQNGTKHQLRIQTRTTETISLEVRGSLPNRLRHRQPCRNPAQMRFKQFSLLSALQPD